MFVLMANAGLRHEILHHEIMKLNALRGAFAFVVESAKLRNKDASDCDAYRACAIAANSTATVLA
jgi:hypothetical protein